MAKEFLDSSARINNTEKNTGRQGGKLSLGRFALRLLGSAGLMASPLIVACAPDAKATATLAPGIGGPNPIATFPGNDPRNEAINEANRKDATARAVDTAIAQATSTAEPQKPPTPEAKKCLGLADCSKVEFFIKPNALGVDVLYAGANLEPGTLLFARRDGQRGTIELGASSSLKGMRITVRNPNLDDPEGVDFITGDIIPLDPDGNVNSYSINVKKGQVIGKVGNSGVTNDGYNFIHTIGIVDPTTGKGITDVKELRDAYEGAPDKPIKRVSKAVQSPPPLTSGPPVFKD